MVELTFGKKIFKQIEIDLTFWDRKSPIIVSGSGSASSNSDAGFGVTTNAIIGAEDEFGNDVLPLTVVDSCSHGITNRPSSCSIDWSFEEDIGPLIGQISKKVKFFIIGNQFASTPQVRTSFTVDQVNVQPFDTLSESPKLIPQITLIASQIRIIEGPVISTADFIARIVINGLGLFQRLDYDIDIRIVDNDRQDIFVEAKLLESIGIDELRTDDIIIEDPNFFPMTSPRLTMTISVGGAVIFDRINVAIAKVVLPPELPPEPEPIPPIPEPEPIPEPMPEPEPGPTPEPVPEDEGSSVPAIVAGIAIIAGIGVAAVVANR